MDKVTAHQAGISALNKVLEKGFVREQARKEEEQNVEINSPSSVVQHPSLKSEESVKEINVPSFFEHPVIAPFLGISNFFNKSGKSK